MRRLPTRQVHLDFHTSPLIPGVGAEFDKKQFQAALKEGNVIWMAHPVCRLYMEQVPYTYIDGVLKFEVPYLRCYQGIEINADEVI